MLRYLRITVTIACLVTSVLLAALWIRSYWRADSIHSRNGNNRYIDLGSNNGIVTISSMKTMSLSPPRPSTGWRLQSSEAVPAPAVFQMTFSPNTRIKLPHASLALLSLAAAIIPWVRSSPRFSLRTMLFVVTVIALSIGLIASMI